MTDLDDGFHRLRVSNTLRVVDRSYLTIRSFHAYELRCFRPSRFMFHTYAWSGGGVERAPKIGPDADGLRKLGRDSQPPPRLHGPLTRLENRERLLVIDLGKIFSPKSVAIVTIEHLFVDTERQFDTHLSDLVTTKQRKQLDLTVLLPEANPHVHFIQEPVGASVVGNPSELLSHEQVFDGNLELAKYEKSVVNPDANTRYKISWEKPKTIDV